MKMNQAAELKILKMILWIYIILCIVIAGLNYGYASKASPQAAAFITWFWHFYENTIKTVFIIVGSMLTLKIVKASKERTMRKSNLIGFIISALAIHIMLPLILNNKELYFFTMPLPWTTTPLQLLHHESSFYLSRVPIWGLTGIMSSLIVYAGIHVIVIVGTLLMGRRWQCSTLCLFNGFASEVFAPAMPLMGKRRKLKQGAVKCFNFLRWVFLVIALFFTSYWIVFLLGYQSGSPFRLISRVENYKYLSTELFMAMFFWIAFTGRGYCYYCPLGTWLALFSKVAGQKIITDQGQCIGCDVCNQVCSMGIDIKEQAQKGEAVIDLRCVGCGHCIDSCPTKTLHYSTRFLDRIAGKNRLPQNDQKVSDSY